MKTTILFLLRKNLIYGSYSSVIAKSGLLNSAQITSHQLKKHLKIHTELEVCVDGNEVDKFLHKHNPRICVLEALWATPEKMKQLVELHRKTVFIVLIHSEIAFLAHEGNAVSWIMQYNDIERVFPAFNSEETYRQFKGLAVTCFYLPNVYLDVERRPVSPNHKTKIDIGCYGAIRPFKNQLIQAIAAITFANLHGKTLHFHMNTTRAEQGGEGVLKNIRALFANYPNHWLIEYGWKNREDFLTLVSKMDFGMQVSFTESFNIVAADFVHQNVPIVVSHTIHWMPDRAKADPEGMADILIKMEYAYLKKQKSADANTEGLQRYNHEALRQWKKLLLSLR